MKKGITLEDLTVGYGKQPVVKDICLSVKPGQILTLIGPNGSGKSTILKSITRQMKFIGGMAYLNSTPMNTMSELEIAKSMSMVMTERIKPEFMTCREVVATGRYPYTGRLGILTTEDWTEVDRAMDLVHANEVSNQNFLRISDGQKQRVMLARAICQDTPIMILDEPTSYLDMKYKLDILSNIRTLAREKRVAIIMSLHELDLAQKISDIIACVDGNQVCCIGSPEIVFRGDFIQKLYSIAEKSFNPILGTTSFPSNSNPPQIFVIGGGGAGIPIYYRLQRANIPFATGILSENDIEYAIAQAIASKMVYTKAFFPIEKEHIRRAKQYIDLCKSCICALDTFGPYNQENQMLRDYAFEQGKLSFK